MRFTGQIVLFFVTELEYHCYEIHWQIIAKIRFQETRLIQTKHLRTLFINNVYWNADSV